jgi:histidinol-phosphate aminotransferase
MDRFFQPHIARMAGYVPGEQPRETGFTKLNTNENPYPPSPRVAEAIRLALEGRLRLYPDPLATAFREAAARLHGVDPEMILAGNGSDDLLTIVTRAFAGPGDAVVYPSPSYILYKTLIELQGSRPVEVVFNDDWSIDPDRFASTGARLAFIANPNSPSGTALAAARVAELAERIAFPLVVDEAYADFADHDCVDLVADHPNVIILRTLSKGYSLAGLRLGYLIARPDVVSGLIKVKDSYNCGTLSLLGGAAALGDQAHHNETRERVISTRDQMTAALRALGYHVPRSQANFLWCTGGPNAADVYEALKARKVLVRLMRYAGHPDGLRITVGTDAEVDRLLHELGPLVGGVSSHAHDRG